MISGMGHLDHSLCRSLLSCCFTLSVLPFRVEAEVTTPGSGVESHWHWTFPRHRLFCTTNPTSRHQPHGLCRVEGQPGIARSVNNLHVPHNLSSCAVRP